MTNPKRYALVGTGGRAEFFYGALAKDFRDSSQLVAFCDINPLRMDYANELLRDKYGYSMVPTYTADHFDDMITKEKPDVVIVTTVDEVKCQAILDAVKRTGKNLRVSFNYRYAPHNTKVRELLMNDAIGKVNSVHFEWLLNTRHGADYFRRWHRDKRNSGGLFVHKATHHFDLVNFWIRSYPKTVFAMGDLMFYGRENAENRGPCPR